MGILVWLDGALPHAADVTRADFGIDAGRLLIRLGATLFGFFGGKIDALVKRALENMRDTLKGVIEAIADFAVTTGTLMARVAGLLKRFLSRVIVPMLQRLDQWALRLHRWLKDTFGPLLHFLLEVRRRIFEIYNKWLRPIFDTIDMVRRILGVLSLLHLDFARKLDEKLAALERRLLLPIQAVIRKINEAIDVLDRVIDLDGFYQRYTLIRSLLKYQRDALKVWWVSIHRPLTGEKLAEYRRPHEVRPAADVANEVLRYINTGDAPNAARIEEYAADFLRGLDAASAR
jgi:hypothetical protein